MAVLELIRCLLKVLKGFQLVLYSFDFYSGFVCLPLKSSILFLGVMYYYISCLYFSCYLKSFFEVIFGFGFCVP